MPQLTEYPLYVETGPKKRKTVVHVLDLLGCIAQGPTTDEALRATPEAIKEYLRFLKSHGEAVDPDIEFTSMIAELNLEGNFFGSSGWKPDFEPLSEEELKVHLRRLEWMQSDLLELVGELTPDRLAEKPESGRAIGHILQHIAGAHKEYVRLTVGRIEGASALIKKAEKEPETVLGVLDELWVLTNPRLHAMTETERTQQVPHGQTIWTAHRGLRRMLEHNWEHMQEIRSRLG